MDSNVRVIVLGTGQMGSGIIKLLLLTDVDGAYTDWGTSAARRQQRATWDKVSDHWTSCRSATLRVCERKRPGTVRPRRSRLHTLWHRFCPLWQ
jgi:3-hydroxyacyl-CoA dehydrogenase